MYRHIHRYLLFVVRKTRCHCEECTWLAGQTSLGFLPRTTRPPVWVFSGRIYRLFFCNFLHFHRLSFGTCFSLRKMRENFICNAVKSHGSIIGELDTCFKETEGKAFGAHQAIGWRRQRGCYGSQGEHLCITSMHEYCCLF